MPTKQEISKQACAKYAKSNGRNLPQAKFLSTLNLLILKGVPVPEAETQAGEFVRNDHPGFEPVLTAQPITSPVWSEKVREHQEALSRQLSRNSGAVGRSELKPPLS